jgi:GntR family transcriptional regulator, transcriptional repressor for pyruvate dehydrogenase complex
VTPGDSERFVRLFADDAAARTPHAIAMRIQQAILVGDLKVGERLPNERDLGGLFGVSRATLREALRLLGAEGLIEVRRGVTGGAFVCVPRSDRVGSALSALIRFHQATPEHFAEFRLTFEPETARLAAERATAEHVARLMGTVARIGAAARPDLPWEEFMDLDIAFHEQVAEASLNPIRVAVMLGLHGAFRQSSLTVGSHDTPAWRTEQCGQLLEVAEAIRLHRPRLAYRHMHRHLISNTAQAAEILAAPADLGCRP